MVWQGLGGQVSIRRATQLLQAAFPVAGLPAIVREGQDADMGRHFEVDDVIGKPRHGAASDWQVWRQSPEQGATSEPAATATVALEATVAAVEPTAGPPSAGDLFAMYYDDTGFYFQNLSSRDRSLTPVAFERLDSSGNPLNRFNGTRWAEFYGTVRAGYCAVIEIIDFRHHLNPNECKRKHIVIRTPNADDATIFFTPAALRSSMFWPASS